LRDDHVRVAADQMSFRRDVGCPSPSANEEHGIVIKETMILSIMRMPHHRQTAIEQGATVLRSATPLTAMIVKDQSL
jgi:hypothetical protein